MRTITASVGLALALTLTVAPETHALDLTPAQTEGPYYPRTKPSETDADLTRLGSGPVARGDVLVLSGRVLDPDGKAIAGARVEIWQTDQQGIYLHPGDQRTAQRDKAFQFYGEAISAADGGFVFRTIVPAAYPGRPRHIHAKITPSGGKTLTTQFYFKGDNLASDGVARRLGNGLSSVTLDPQPAAGALNASVVVVVPRGRGA